MNATRNGHFGLVAACWAILLLTAAPTAADTFSIDAASPSAGASLLPGSVLAFGPTTHVPQQSFGLAIGDELDALSDGTDIGQIIFFSVGRGSTGAAGQTDLFTVGGQALRGQQAGDVFVTVTADGVLSRPVGYNQLATDQTQYGLSPILAPFFYNSGPLDNLDALNFSEFDTLPVGGDGTPDRAIFFSLAAGSPTLTTLGASAADVLLWNPVDSTLSIWQPATTLGLTSGDDLDALALGVVANPDGSYTPVQAWFSLAPGSPSLGGDSGADIFHTTFGGDYSLLYTAEQLGLSDADNVDALEISPVPEPATLALLLVGGALAIGLARRRRVR
ncbi:MAG: hypothetical protein BIFFINMI_04025 [Phycisphaerae bacterium]|nr:hypothetical protein [Phycisphaerae bacterium]